MLADRSISAVDGLSCAGCRAFGRDGWTTGVMLRRRSLQTDSTGNIFPICANMVISWSMDSCAAFANPLWLTALASLVTSVAALVWAVRRKR